MSNGMNLYQMTTEYAYKIEAILSDLDEGEIDNIDEWLTSATNELNSKRLAVAGYIKTLEAEYDAMTLAAERIVERSLKKKNHIYYLMAYLQRSLERTKTSCVKGVEFDIKLQKNPSSVFIYDENEVLDKWKVKTGSITFKPDKNLIKKAINAGEIVPGCRLIQEERIEIK